MDNNEQQLAAMDNNGLQSVVLHASVMPFYIIHHEATSGYDISELFATHREIEDEDVGRVPHCLVQQNDKDDKKIAYEADHDDKGKQDGDDDGDDRHQGLQLLQVDLLLPLLNHYCAIHLMNNLFKTSANLLSLKFFCNLGNASKLDSTQQRSNVSGISCQSFFQSWPFQIISHPQTLEDSLTFIGTNIKHIESALPFFNMKFG